MFDAIVVTGLELCYFNILPYLTWFVVWVFVVNVVRVFVGLLGELGEETEYSSTERRTKRSFIVRIIGEMGLIVVKIG